MEPSLKVLGMKPYGYHNYHGAISKLSLKNIKKIIEIVNWDKIYRPTADPPADNSYKCMFSTQFSCKGPPTVTLSKHFFNFWKYKYKIQIKHTQNTNTNRDTWQESSPPCPPAQSMSSVIVESPIWAAWHVASDTMPTWCLFDICLILVSIFLIDFIWVRYELLGTLHPIRCQPETYFWNDQKLWRTSCERSWPFFWLR